MGEQLAAVWGPAGVIVVALATACLWLWREYKSTQDARVEDAKRVVKTVLEITDRQRAVTAELTKAIDQNNAALQELRSILHDRRRS